MQAEAPEAVSLDGETEATRRLYGLDNPTTEPYGTRLLLARRLVERGVRFVQVYSGGTRVNWDAHADLAGNHRERCAETDKPIAGLLQDLKQRGLLKDTLVIWGAEFGRMPISQDGNGRDHNPHAFLMWLAGGGVKAGFSHGASDDLGYLPAADPVSVHDFHATILHLLGLDHKRLTFEHDGRSMRLTDVAGRVVTEIFA
jgi:arylsulfatase A-like enzyme